MVLELIERVLAALIIIGLLVVVLFLAFPDRNFGIGKAERDNQEEPQQKQSKKQSKDGELPKSDAKPFSKTAAQRPDSRDNRKAVYHALRRRTPSPSKRVSYKNRRNPSSTPRVERIYYDDIYYDPPDHTDYYDCVGQSCSCGCERRPYWAPPAPNCW